jgi:hypothetical protein
MARVMVRDCQWDGLGEFELAFSDELINDFHGVEDFDLGAELGVEVLEAMVAISTGGDHSLYPGFSNLLGQEPLDIQLL